MRTDAAVDLGLLSPVTAGHEEQVADAAVLDALVRAECGLVAAYIAVGAVDDPDQVRREAEALAGGDVRALALAAVAGGNPVIPLVGRLRDAAGARVQPWVHRGATSQDILDTALMLVARDAAAGILSSLDDVADSLERFAHDHRDLVAAARTLTQHAVPTTMGARASVWLHAVRRARERMAGLAFPAQLGGAGGTLAAFVEIAGAERAVRLPAAFAEALALDVPDGVWHVMRWPITEIGDAVTQALDALGVIATDVATLARTEIGELAEGTGGGSSAMPQKQNPARSVLIRSAAIRAPHLAATLHAASSLAVDERPDGSWHAEWPALRELLRLGLGASAHAAELVAGLRVDPAAVARNLGLTGGLIVAERLSLVLAPVIGRKRVDEIIAQGGSGADVKALVTAALAETGASHLDPDDLLDPARYTGLAAAAAVSGQPARNEEEA